MSLLSVFTVNLHKADDRYKDYDYKYEFQTYFVIYFNVEEVNKRITDFKIAGTISGYDTMYLSVIYTSNSPAVYISD